MSIQSRCVDDATFIQQNHLHAGQGDAAAQSSNVNASRTHCKKPHAQLAARSRAQRAGNIPRKYVLQARKLGHGVSPACSRLRWPSWVWNPWAHSRVHLVNPSSRLALGTEWKKPVQRAQCMIFHFSKAQSTSKTKPCVMGNDKHQGSGARTSEGQAGLWWGVEPTAPGRFRLDVGSLSFYFVKHTCFY